MKKKLLKFICNLILIPELRRKFRKHFLEPKMLFEIKVKPKIPPYEKVKVSVIIPVYNKFELTYECLKSISYYLPKVPFEVIIADDASSDKTKNIERYVKSVKLVKTSGNMGFLKNVNNAVSFARGEYIFLMNNDMLVCENWLDSLVELMDKDNSIGIAGSLDLNKDNEIMEYGGTIYNSGVTSWNGLDGFELENLPLREVDYCSGCSILFKKSDWDKLGGFDERFAPAYYEDTDFCMAMRHILNKKVVCNPRSKIVHWPSSSYSQRTIDLMNTNREKFVEKWKLELRKYKSKG